MTMAAPGTRGEDADLAHRRTLEALAAGAADDHPDDPRGQVARNPDEGRFAAAGVDGTHEAHRLPRHWFWKTPIRGDDGIRATTPGNHVAAKPNHAWELFRYAFAKKHHT
jgi:hypothetical protein